MHNYYTTTIITQNDILILHLEHIYLLDKNGNKHNLGNEKFSFEQTNDIYGTTYTAESDWRPYTIHLDTLKKVTKNKIDLHSTTPFYVSLGKLSNWDSYISYDLYLTPNEIEIVSQEDYSKEMSEESIYHYINHTLKLKNFKSHICTTLSKVLTEGELIKEYDWYNHHTKIAEIIERLTELGGKEDKVKVLQGHLDNGKEFVYHYTELVDLPKTITFREFSRVEYTPTYERRKKLAEDLEKVGIKLTTYDIGKFENNGYKIVKSRK